LIGLLLRVGPEDETRQAIEQFERRFSTNRHDSESLSPSQRKTLEAMKSMLWESQSLKVSA
jgi:hypothetical protein